MIAGARKWQYRGRRTHCRRHTLCRVQLVDGHGGKVGNIEVAAEKKKLGEKTLQKGKETKNSVAKMQKNISLRVRRAGGKYAFQKLINLI